MSAPTKDEVAKARKHAETVAAALDREAESAAETGRMRACLGAESAASSIRTILRALDAAETERKDNVGALEDAGVDRNEADEIASGIEALAQDRDELLAEWSKVGDLFFPDREPDDGWSADEIADAVREIRRERDELAKLVPDLRESLGTAHERAGRMERERDELAREACRAFGAEPVPTTERALDHIRSLWVAASSDSARRRAEKAEARVRALEEELARAAGMRSRQED